MINIKTILTPVLLSLGVWGGRILAHGGGADSSGTANVEAATGTFLVRIVLFATAIVLLLIALAIGLQRPGEAVKRILFWSIVTVVVTTTVILAGTTVRLNITSWSKGPIHWHADMEVFACGEELDLVDPGGFINRVGTSTQHEHGDKRLHFEGVVVSPEDIELSNFLRSIGIELTETNLDFPTNHGLIHYSNGDTCPDGTAGEVQVFLWQTDRQTSMYSQRKLTDYETYVIAPQSQVPPGDCLIVEFGEPKERTDQLCQSYEVAEQTDKLKGEVRSNGR